MLKRRKQKRKKMKMRATSFLSSFLFQRHNSEAQVFSFCDRNFERSRRKERFRTMSNIFSSQKVLIEIWISNEMHTQARHLMEYSDMLSSSGRKKGDFLFHCQVYVWFRVTHTAWSFPVVRWSFMWIMPNWWLSLLSPSHFRLSDHYTWQLVSESLLKINFANLIWNN